MRILMLGDSPLGTTGFGRVNRVAAEAFLREGWTLASVTALQWEEKETDLPIRQFVPVRTDALGLDVAGPAVEEFQPDLIYATCEPGVLTALASVVPARIPFLAYVPIEGEPLIYRDWRAVLNEINWFTCSKYGADVAKRDLGMDVDFVYHGVDHDVFYPDDERRYYWRERLGWNGKFVVMTVAANVRRKQHPRLFEAISILKKQYKQRDIILYDHTVPYQQHWLDGWHLPQVADAYGIHDEVVFNPLLSAFGKSIPEGSSDEAPGLADLYRAADLFVLPSQVEGFGLPTAEAMASGLPVMVTRYAAGWEVASPAGYGLPVSDWEVAKSGTRYANVSPNDIAKAILNVKRDPKRLLRMKQAGLSRAKDYDWQKFQEYVVDAAKKAKPVEGYEVDQPEVQAVSGSSQDVDQGSAPDGPQA